jgi:uncharacterized protein (UPF0261 family)
MAVLLIGTLDTKGEELAFARDRLRAEGLEVIVLDAGTGNERAAASGPGPSDVLRAVGNTHDSQVSALDRGQAVALAAKGAATTALRLWHEGKVEGVLALGGSAGTTIGTSAMRALPFGLPKVMVSTLASGQTRPYVGGSDLALFPSVADVAGLNRVTRTVLANAAAALAGMVRGRRFSSSAEPPTRPLVTATMFGVTTPCVTRAREQLEARGFEVIVFHATGVGGQAMEGLIRDGQTTGVLDLTTTEIADELVGGVLSAGPDRLRAAIDAGVPQVVSVGALDMVNFGPIESVPERFRTRLLHVHNPTVTLMRTTPDENARIGTHIGRILATAHAPLAVMLPLRGVSAIDAPDKPFHDPSANSRLFTCLKDELKDNPMVRIVERDEHINDPSFADCAVAILQELIAAATTRSSP